MKSFEIGDLVLLKSGGPLMTVTQVHPDSGLSVSGCVQGTWFNGGIVMSYVFPPEALKYHDEQDDD